VNYKIISVDKDHYDAPRELETQVNTFLYSNPGFFASTPPVMTDEHLIQMLVNSDILDG
jgi:hypothetical protein